MMKHWILEGHTPVITHSVEEWGRWFKLSSRVVRQDIVRPKWYTPSVYVSTVFLGLDHNFWDDGPPILFETMIFGGLCDDYQRRYSTWDEAITGHRATLDMIHAAYRFPMGLWPLVLYVLRAWHLSALWKHRSSFR